MAENKIKKKNLYFLSLLIKPKEEAEHLASHASLDITLK